MPPLIEHAECFDWTTSTAYWAGTYFIAQISQILQWGRGTPASFVMRNNGGAKLGKLLPAHATKGVACAFSYGGNYGNIETNPRDCSLFEFWEGGVCHWYLRAHYTGVLEAIDSTGALLGASIIPLPPGTNGSGGLFQWVECVQTIGATGSIVVKVDGITHINLPSVNNKAAGTSGVVNQIRVNAHGNGGARQVGEIVWHDGSSFLDDSRVAYLPAIAAGTFQDGVGTSGTLLSNVDDTDCDGDTTTVSLASSGLPLTTTYGVGSLPATAARVYAVLPHIVAKKSDPGVNKGRPVLIVGGTYDDGGIDLDVSDFYGPIARVLNLNPNTGAAWAAGAGPIEIGWQRTA